MKPLLIVDGYNVIGAWSEVERKQWALDASRDRLLHLLQDYSGYSGEEVVLVFDGYQSDRQTDTEEKYGDLTLVYTHHGETADSYIERLVAQTPKYRDVRVATSDGLEQSQVLSTGAVRLTSRELLRELKQARQQGMAGHQQSAGVQRTQLGARLPQGTLDVLEKLRRADMPAVIEPEKPKPKPVPKAVPKSAPKPAAKPAPKKAPDKPNPKDQQQNGVTVKILPNGRMIIKDPQKIPSASPESKRRHK